MRLCVCACVCVCVYVLVCVSRVQLCEHMDLYPTRLLCLWYFPGKKNWSGLLCPPPGDLPDSGIKFTSPAPPVLVDRFFTTELPGNPFDAHNKI